MPLTRPSPAASPPPLPPDDRGDTVLSLAPSRTGSSIAGAVPITIPYVAVDSNGGFFNTWAPYGNNAPERVSSCSRLLRSDDRGAAGAGGASLCPLRATPSTRRLRAFLRAVDAARHLPLGRRAPPGTRS